MSILDLGYGFNVWLRKSKSCPALYCRSIWCCLLSEPAACVWPAWAGGCCPTHQYQSPERLQNFQPPTRSPLQNVDQINPAAAMFSLDNQSTLQVLKTDTVVSSMSQTWTVFSAPCCLLLFVWLCQFSNDKKLLSSRELRLLLSTFFAITSRHA